MPQYIFPHDGAPEWYALDAFTRGYIEAAFFTECHEDNPELEHMTFSDIAPESLAKMVADCAEFQAKNATAIEAACEAAGKGADSAGADFWFTRNGHGVGFWENGRWPDHGDTLDEAAKAWREVYLYAGDDGRLYAA